MSDMLRRVVMMMRKSVVVTYATWNPSDKSSDITLSGGDLVASYNTPAANCLVRSTVSKSSGKWYWEITCTTTANYAYIGIGNASTSTVNYPGQDGNSLGYTNDGYLIKSGASFSTVPDPYITSDVLGFALDAGAGTIEFFKNNVSQGSYSHGIAGAIYATLGTSAGAAANTYTANFGASAFTYTPPSGYNAGLYT